MYKVSVSGSFHRHLGIMKDAIEEFKQLGCEVLSPRDVTVVAEIGDFLFVASDPYRSIKLVEGRHLLSIAASDFLWLVAPDGYIGQSASLEVGYAIAKGKVIYCERVPPDLTIAEYVSAIETPRHALDDYARLRAKRENATSSILVDPIEGSKEAHYLVDKIAYLLSKPGLITPAALETEVAAVSRRLITMMNLNLQWPLLDRCLPTKRGLRDDPIQFYKVPH